MTRSRTALHALASGALFTVLLEVLSSFSTGLHAGRVLLAGVLFALGTYVLARRRQQPRD